MAFNTLKVGCVFFSVLLQDINTRKPFKSSVIKDQQVISLATRPLAIAETYHCTEPPPALQKLNPYRYQRMYFCKMCNMYYSGLWIDECTAVLVAQALHVHSTYAHHYTTLPYF